MCGRSGRLWRAVVVGKTYPLLRETTSTLVLGVAEEFDDTLLVGSETVALLAQALWCCGCKGRRRQALHVRIPLPSTSDCRQFERTQRPHG